MRGNHQWLVDSPNKGPIILIHDCLYAASLLAVEHTFRTDLLQQISVTGTPKLSFLILEGPLNHAVTMATEEHQLTYRCSEAVVIGSSGQLTSTHLLWTRGHLNIQIFFFRYRCSFYWDETAMRLMAIPIHGKTVIILSQDLRVEAAT